MKHLFKSLFGIILFAVLISCSPKELPESSAYWKEKYTQYQTFTINTDDIVFFGDDIMDRGEWLSYYEEPDSVSKRDNNHLRGDDEPLFIKNRGIALEPSSLALFRAKEIVKSEPAKLFISTGAIDIRNGVSANEIGQNILDIISLVIEESPGTEIYYLSILPDSKIISKGWSAYKDVIHINTVMQNMAQESKNFNYIDIFTPLVSPVQIAETKDTVVTYKNAHSIDNQYTIDGNVLSGTGYAKLAKILERYVGYEAKNFPTDFVADWDMIHYAQRTSIFHAMPKSTGRIMMLGNSLTNCARWEELRPEYKFINRGISGDKLEGIYNRLDEAIAHKPREIYLLSGTNDFFADANEPVDSVAQRYIAIIEKIRTKLPNTRLYVESTLPLSPLTNLYGNLNSKIEELNNILKDNAATWGYTYVDVASHLKDEKGDLDAQYTYDGIHLNGEGYKVLSSIIPIDEEVADAQSFNTADWDIKEVANGVTLSRFHFKDGHRIFNSNQYISIVEFDTKVAKGRFALANEPGAINQTSKFAKDSGAVVAMNGTFYNMRPDYNSVCFFRKFGKEEYILNEKMEQRDNGALAFDEKGRASIVMAPVDEKGIVLETEWAKNIEDPNVIGAGPMLVVDGESAPLIKNAFNKNRHPRSGVAIKGKKIYFVTVDGRSSASQGVSLWEFTRIMHYLGVEDAINFDGGGSTTLYVEGESETGVVNHPSDNRVFDHLGERRVVNALLYIE